MHFSIINAFISLLTFSQVLDTAYAYPSQDPTRTDYDVLLQKNQLNKGTDEETLFEKRATDPPLTNWGQGPGTTWSGFVTQPANSQWTTDTIDEYAVAAWRKTQSASNPPPVLVAALWVQGAGVYMGSIPHGTPVGSSSISVQVAFDGMLRSQAPVLWEQVKLRQYQNTSKWHAEDMAMYVFERERRPTGPKYPANSYMVVYGQYDGRDKAGPKPPCRGMNDKGDGIQPSCAQVLRALGITSEC
jgi:hypothetical protein